MKWIGLTGGIGTGKSTVAAMFRECGVPVIDADAISRSILDLKGSGVEEVLEVFGPEILDGAGRIDRKRLGDIVFKDPKKRKALEGIIHPHVQRRVSLEKEELESHNEAIAIYDVPLLFEANLENQFDKVIVVSCLPDIQVSRIVQRDGLSVEEAQRRISSQQPLDDKIAKSDIEIKNNGSIEDLKDTVVNVLSRL